MKKTFKSALQRVKKLERSVIVKAASFTPPAERLGPVCARVLALQLKRAEDKLQGKFEGLKAEERRKKPLKSMMENLCAGASGVPCEPHLNPGDCE